MSEVRITDEMVNAFVEAHLKADGALFSERVRVGLSAALSGMAEAEEPCPVCGCEERGQGGYLSCECPAPAKGADRAVEVARTIWLYFRGQHETPVEAGAWFDNHKTLGGPAYIIDLVRSASISEISRLKKALENWRHEVGAKASRIDTLDAENERLRNALNDAESVLQSIIVDCQGASVCGEPEMGLEAIYHKASDAVSTLQTEGK